MKKWFIIAFLGLWACNEADENKNRAYSYGQLMYQNYCSNCHGDNGEGVVRVFPPLANSDYMKNNFNNIACIIKYGMRDSVYVNGVDYNGIMPNVPGITALEISYINTFIYTKFLGIDTLFTEKDVELSLKSCK